MKSKGINAFQLKLFMAFLMVFDHISQIPGLVPDGWDGVLHALTRCVGEHLPSWQWKVFSTLATVWLTICGSSFGQP